MGLITSEIIFDYPAPQPAQIIEEITKISGLPVIEVYPYETNNQTDSEEFDDEEILYEFIQYIAFKDIPKCSIQIYAYIPNAINESVAIEKLETGFDANWPQPCHGASEQDGKQSIYLESYVGTESILFLATIKVLESLGGIRKYQGSFSNALEEYPLTIEKLKKNHKKVKRKILYAYLLSILMLPLILPFIMIKMIFFIFKIPFEISRSMKAVKKHYPDEFKDK
ncbi:MAG: hypothetical protein JKY19_07190 [Alcanivoracaceae bacterium]|nr:hypothetical protein [Alcanivoracaceae bacterium]